jgi:hypothetical protein
MATNNSNQGGTLTSYPIARTFAFVVLAALAGLVLMRHLFGSISIEGGVR